MERPRVVHVTIELGVFNSSGRGNRITGTQCHWVIGQSEPEIRMKPSSRFSRSMSGTLLRVFRLDFLCLSLEEPH